MTLLAWLAWKLLSFSIILEINKFILPLPLKRIDIDFVFHTLSNHQEELLLLFGQTSTYILSVNLHPSWFHAGLRMQIQIRCGVKSWPALNLGQKTLQIQNKLNIVLNVFLQRNVRSCPQMAAKRLCVSSQRNMTENRRDFTLSLDWLTLKY